MARAVILLHGLFRTGLSMLPMEWALRRSGYTKVLTPTTGHHLHEIPASAQKLAQTVQRLHDEYGAVDAVTHSTGGLLARAIMPLAPLRRVVMLAPPNHGAQAAELAREMLPVHRLASWDPLAKLLPGATAELPMGPAEIGIITGGTGDEGGFNTRLEGDNDQTVRVDEARLDSALEFAVVPVRHTFVMAHAEVQAMTVHFMEHGRFHP